ncbi:MAG: pyruvate kinase [Gammaproteobacteria bacterium]|nr:pyruvate kinase [Gammaproteobacteria bacterium]
MFRRTKIVATLGPATDDPKILDKIIEAGVDVVRINFSHGSSDEHKARVEKIRSRARAHGRQVGVLADLQGPKIRIDCFQKGSVELKEGETFIFDAGLAIGAGNKERVGLGYKELVDDVKRGDTLLLDDGRLVFWVDHVNNQEIFTRVVVGGTLSDRKGINLQGGGLSAAALSEKDKEDIITAAELEADYLAVSFPVCADDINLARKLLRNAGGKGGIVAKIERAEALNCVDEIIEASDAIMIARGDLGVEIGDAALPPIQKDLIRRARTMNRVVITATQMMESMIENQIPTRAEVFDVANAVLDGTDAVMLSGETAMGKFPDKAIAAMDRICKEAEKQKQASESNHRMHTKFKFIDEAIAMASMYTANHLNVKAIVSLTESGATTLWMSRIGSGIPIYAFTSHVDTRRKVTLYRGVMPVSFDTSGIDRKMLIDEIVDELKRRGVAKDGDLVLISRGDLDGIMGGTNTMKIVRIGDICNITG